MASTLCEFFQPSNLRQIVCSVEDWILRSQPNSVRGVDTRWCFPADYELDAQDEKNTVVGVRHHRVLLGLILRYHV